MSESKTSDNNAFCNALSNLEKKYQIGSYSVKLIFTAECRDYSPKKTKETLALKMNIKVNKNESLFNLISDKLISNKNFFIHSGVIPVMLVEDATEKKITNDKYHCILIESEVSNTPFIESECNYKLFKQ